jgi:VCBS repeat-containing protein
VFGKVIEGMDTARELSRTPTDDRGRPLYGAHLENVTWVDPPDRESPPPELSAYGFDCVEVAESGDEAEYLLAFRNTGQSILEGQLEASIDREGWDVTLRNANASRLAISSGQTVAYGLNVSVPASAENGIEETVNVTVEGVDEDVSTSLELTTRVDELGSPASEQDQVEARYVGVLKDGRPFRTTETVYAEEESLTWFQDPPEDPKPVRIDTGKTQLGDVIERARLGETVVAINAPQGADSRSYGENGLGGRLLIFQVHVTATSS